MLLQNKKCKSCNGDKYFYYFYTSEKTKKFDLKTKTVCFSCLGSGLYIDINVCNNDLIYGDLFNNKGIEDRYLLFYYLTILKLTYKSFTLKLADDLIERKATGKDFRLVTNIQLALLKMKRFLKSIRNYFIANYRSKILIRVINSLLGLSMKFIQYIDTNDKVPKAYYKFLADHLRFQSILNNISEELKVIYINV